MQPSSKTVPLVFVSCGQSTASERNLGKEIVELVERTTGCSAYFAENQSNFEGVTENILKKLNEAVAFIGVMHPRGNVTNPHDPQVGTWVRGSVWVEQEIAIAAFLTQALSRSLEARSYVHESIRREGLRDKLILNSIPFSDDSAILTDLATFLPKWKLLQPRKAPLSLKAIINHQRVAIPGGPASPNEARYELRAGVENDGTEQAMEFRIDVEIPSGLLDGGGHALMSNSERPGFVRFRLDSEARGIKHLYPGDRIENLIIFNYAVTDRVLRYSPELLNEQLIATVYSGNMTPHRTIKSFAELRS